ncbi:EAL domain-containing protein [Methylocucumis oryzae]|uniref:EAL domain-containing protein n=1 Tax=Methylocucumis oryzae TaxID=1632867 RepID=UPI000AD0B3D3|nr:EAL domain-containing protein [Methylocucumis oryzae]
MTALRDEIVNIIEGERLTPIFQPIISLLHKDILGYEALIRGPSDSSLHSPYNLFSAAERHGLSTKLEFCCRKISIQYYSRLKLAKKLFINVSPSVLLQPDFKMGMTLKYLEQAGLDPKSVVIELTESQPTDNYPLMRDAVMHYRQMGFEIALDDLGAGYSGLRLWSELLPDYVKIDKHFIHGIHEDSVKYNFVRSIQSIASSLNCNIIAEGVETKEEFKTVESLGITHAQGYYFARPNAQPPERIDPALLVSNRISPLLVHSFNGHSPQTRSILKIVEPVTSATSISQVMDLFQQNSQLTMIPVVDNLLATGIIFRDRFLSKLFSSRYGLELYGKKPISLFVSKMPLMFDVNTPLETVSQMLTSNSENDSAFYRDRKQLLSRCSDGFRLARRDYPATNHKCQTC